MAARMSHVNSYMLGSMRWASPMGLAMALGKCFGTYHYVDGCGTVAEADYYVDSVRNWRGKGILCIDRESGGNAAWSDQSYLGALGARVIERTGIKPIVYGQQSILGMLQSVSAKYDCGLWVAQYADMNPTGYQDSPWNEGAFPCAIRQYSSCGSLPGWGTRSTSTSSTVTSTHEARTPVRHRRVRCLRRDCSQFPTRRTPGSPAIQRSAAQQTRPSGRATRTTPTLGGGGSLHRSRRPGRRGRGSVQDSSAIPCELPGQCARGGSCDDFASVEIAEPKRNSGFYAGVSCLRVIHKVVRKNTRNVVIRRDSQ